MAADQEQFFRILSTLLSPDNNVRSQAEVSKLNNLLKIYSLDLQLIERQSILSLKKQLEIFHTTCSFQTVLLSNLL